MYVFKKSILCVLSVILISGVLSGCNTTRGFGEDVENTGRAIKNA